MTFPTESAVRLPPNRPILVAARWSEPNGKRAAVQVVDDLIGAVIELDRLLGTSWKHALPQRDVLIAKVRAAPREVTAGPDGESFSNSFVELTPDPGLVVSISTGSGSKTDEDLDQPHSSHLVRKIRSIRPALVFSKRIDRLCRDVGGLSKILAAAELEGALIGSAADIGDPADPFFFGRLIAESIQARAYMKQWPLHTRRAMNIKTSSKMQNGWFAYHATPPPPPGLTKVTMPPSPYDNHPVRVYFDCPSGLPQFEAGMRWYPQVLDSSGVQVDQVENVRLILKEYGKIPDYNLALLLQSRQYSTDSYRRQKRSAKAAISVRNAVDAGQIIRTVLNHLDVYETGQWSVSIGKNAPEGMETKTIRGLIPPDGPWAPPERFPEIRDVMRRRKEIRGESRVSMSLSGVSVTFEGKPYRLVSATHSTPAYRLILDRGGAETWLNPAFAGHFVTHEAIADSLVTGMLAVANEGLPQALLAKSVPETAQVLLSGKHDTAIRKHVEIQSEIGNLTAALARGGLSETAACHITAEINRRTEDAVTAEQEVRALQSELEELERSQSAAVSQFEVSQLADLISQLQDSTSTTLNSALKSAIRDLEIEVETCKIGSVWRTKKIRWHGRLCTRSGDAEWDVPFDGESWSGIGARIDRRTATLLHELQSGHCFADIDIPMKYSLIGRVAREFEDLGGVRPPTLRGYGLWAAGHPEITSVLARYHAGQSNEECAKELQSEACRVQRIIEANQIGRRSWFVDRDQAIDKSLRFLWSRGPVSTKELAAAVDGRPMDGRSRWKGLSSLLRRRGEDRFFLIRDGQIMGKPCAWCGGGPVARMGIPEPTGLVCLACRRDEVGFVWDATYDPFVIGHSAWLEIGVELAGAAWQTEGARRNGRPTGPRPDSAV